MNCQEQYTCLAPTNPVRGPSEKASEAALVRPQGASRNHNDDPVCILRVKCELWYSKTTAPLTSDQFDWLLHSHRRNEGMKTSILTIGADLIA